jgi:hypothetical protein
MAQDLSDIDLDTQSSPVKATHIRKPPTPLASLEPRRFLKETSRSQRRKEAARLRFAQVAPVTSLTLLHYTACHSILSCVVGCPSSEAGCNVPRNGAVESGATTAIFTGQQSQLWQRKSPQARFCPS